MGVVRNGGAWDNKAIRPGDSGIQCPNTGNVWNGWGSDVHWYPDGSSQRTFKFDDEGRPDAQPRTVVTKDGYHLTLSGTFYFNTAFDCTKEGKDLSKEFDKQFSNRPVHPFDDWGGWLNLDVLPVIDGAVRQLSQYDCAELLASCSLVQRKQQTAEQVSVDGIQTTLSDALEAGLQAKFHHDYFVNITLQINRPEPSEDLLASIEDAQGSFSEVTKARARNQAARIDKRANLTREKGYRSCPSCARQDEFKAFGDSLPDSVTSVTFGVPIAGR